MLASPRRPGITLLELAIILSIVGVFVWITLPTMRPSGAEAQIDFAKERLAYLHTFEQSYFSLHGKYAPLSVIAKDPDLKKRFDQRFNKDEVTIQGIVFRGPKVETEIYEITAELPNNGGRYKVDQSGEVKAILTGLP